MFPRVEEVVLDNNELTCLQLTRMPKMHALSLNKNKVKYYKVANDAAGKSQCFLRNSCFCFCMLDLCTDYFVSPLLLDCMWLNVYVPLINRIIRALHVPALYL